VRRRISRTRPGGSPTLSELGAALAGFSDAVLSGRDAGGGPVSVRRRVRFDPATGTVRCERAPGVDLVDGRASLLCHGHDLGLARLRSFAVRGRLLTDGAEWLLHPTGMITGLGMSGPVGDLRVFLAARRRAGRYLAVRGLPRPQVPWWRLRSSS
jgi:hypothetical protein